MVININTYTDMHTHVDNDTIPPEKIMFLFQMKEKLNCKILLKEN